jgi:hypothetical protein
VTPAEIEAARQASAAGVALAAESALPDEAAAIAELEQAIRALKLEIRAGAVAEAERATLEARLQDLKKGSGR